MNLTVVAESVLSRVYGDYRKFARYLGVGILTTLVDWAIFYLLIQYGGVYYLLALVVSYLSSTVLSFFLNRRYTFRSLAREVHFQFASFFSVAVTGLLLTELIVAGLVYLLSGSSNGTVVLVSRAVATGVVFIWNFALNKRVTFGIFR